MSYIIPTTILELKRNLIYDLFYIKKVLRHLGLCFLLFPRKIRSKSVESVNSVSRNEIQ